MKQLFACLLVSLIALVSARPWGQINQAVGISMEADSMSMQSDSLYNTELDSLFIEEVSLTLPASVTDNIAYTVNARQKKKAYLLEQDSLLQQDVVRLDAKVKGKQKRIQQLQQSLVSLAEIEKLLTKQSGKVSTASSLEVSDLETELNQRSRGRKSNHP